MEKPEASALLKMTGSIPITLDEPRKRRDKQSQPYTVHDIIVHPSVVQRARKSADFEQSLVQLAMYSIQSTFPGVLLKKGMLYVCINCSCNID